MGAVWYRARAELRRGWRSAVAMGVLVGILAGGGIAAAAGARRTHTAYPRFLERYGTYHASVAVGEEDLDELARIPQVRALASTRLFFGSITPPRSAPLSFPDVFLVASMVPRGGVVPMKVLAGRLAHPDSPDEVVVSYAVAERVDEGIRVGDGLTGELLAPGAPRPQPFRVRVVGIVVQPGGFETLTGRGFPSVVAFTRAFGERFGAFADTSGGATTGVTLARGEADVSALSDELRRRGIRTDGPPTPISGFTEDVQELNRVPEVALASLAALLAIAALAIFGQAIARGASLVADDTPTLRAFGMSRAELFITAMARVLAVAVVAAATAIGVAVLASPLTPVGIARIAEPDPGFAFDALAVAVGAAVTLIAAVCTGALPAWRGAVAAAARTAASRRGSKIAESIARTPAPPAAVTGVRLALDPGRASDTVPVRAATIGSVVAIGAVIASLVFVSSLDHLLLSPRLNGYTWDAAVVPNGPDDMPALEAAVPRDIVARAWKGTVFPFVDVEGLSLTAVVSDGPPPAIIDGRGPRTADEVALDPLTLEQLGKRIGDQVVVKDASETGEPPEPTQPRALRIVGSFVVARIPFQASENPSQGVSLTPDGLRRIDPFEFEALHVLFRRGVDSDMGIPRMRQATAGHAFVVFSPQNVAAVRNMQRIGELPVIVGLLLALIAVATLAHTLVSTTRRRRRDLAILKTIGFVGKQLRATVRWQSRTLVITSLALGIPLGAVVGRWGWRLFAREIIVVPVPIVPLHWFGWVTVVAILFGTMIAAFPARAAARTQPALVLRTE